MRTCCCANSGLTEQAEQHKMNGLRHLVALDIARRAKAAGKVTALGGPGRAPDADETVAVGRTDRTELPEEKRAQDQKNPPLGLQGSLPDREGSRRVVLAHRVCRLRDRGGIGVSRTGRAGFQTASASRYQKGARRYQTRQNQKARDDIERRRLLTLCLMRNHRQLHRCVVVDRSVRFGDGTYPEVVRPSAQPTLSKKLHE